MSVATIKSDREGVCPALYSTVQKQLYKFMTFTTSCIMYEIVKMTKVMNSYNGCCTPHPSIVYSKTTVIQTDLSSLVPRLFLC